MYLLCVSLSIYLLTCLFYFHLHLSALSLSHFPISLCFYSLLPHSNWVSLIGWEQAKKQEPGMAHSPKAKTSGFSTVRPGSTPPLNIATPSRWFKPEVDSPSPIRSILIEEKAIKDLKRFYSNVKLVKPNPDAAS